MTFTPQVFTQTDNNNCIASSSASAFNGTSTVTTGFNTLVLTIKSTTNSTAGGIEIQFSDDYSSWITPGKLTPFGDSNRLRKWTLAGR